MKPWLPAARRTATPSPCVILSTPSGANGALARVTEDAAQKRVLRALEKLRTLFAKRGVTLTAALIAGAVSANSVQAAPSGIVKTISVVAASKGVAVSASTSALVKGVLQLIGLVKSKNNNCHGCGGNSGNGNNHNDCSASKSSGGSAKTAAYRCRRD